MFERLLGFWGTSKDIVEAERYLNHARAQGVKVSNPHGGRAFRHGLRRKDLEAAHENSTRVSSRDGQRAGR